MNVFNAEMFFLDFPMWLKSMFKKVKPLQGWDNNIYKP